MRRKPFSFSFRDRERRPLLATLAPVLSNSLADGKEATEGQKLDELQPPAPASPTKKTESVQRPVPPEGIVSRSDLDLFHYSVKTDRRIHIQPLFQERKSCEAQVATAILVNRGEMKSPIKLEERSSLQPTRPDALKGVQKRRPSGRIKSRKSTDTRPPAPVEEDAFETSKVDRIATQGNSITPKAKKPDNTVSRGGGQQPDKSVGNNLESQQDGGHTGTVSQGTEKRNTLVPRDASPSKKQSAVKRNAPDKRSVSYFAVKPVHVKANQNISRLKPKNGVLPWTYKDFLPTPEEKRRQKKEIPETAAESVFKPVRVAIPLLSKILFDQVVNISHRELRLKIELLSTREIVFDTMATTKKDQRAPPTKLRLSAAAIDEYEANMGLDDRFSTHWYSRVVKDLSIDKDNSLQLDWKSQVEDPTYEGSMKYKKQTIPIVARPVIDGQLLFTIDTGGKKLQVMLRSTEMLQIREAMGNRSEEQSEVDIEILQHDKTWLEHLIMTRQIIKLAVAGIVERNVDPAEEEEEEPPDQYEAAINALDEENEEEEEPRELMSFKVDTVGPMEFSLPTLRTPRRRRSYAGSIDSTATTPIITASIQKLASAVADEAMEKAYRFIRQNRAAAALAMKYISEAAQDRRTSPERTSFDSVIQNYQREQDEERVLEGIYYDLVDEILHSELCPFLRRPKLGNRPDEESASAIRIQSQYRMRKQRREYIRRRNVKCSAARLIQSLQRRVLARKTVLEKKSEREKYLYFSKAGKIARNSNIVNSHDLLKRRARGIRRQRVEFLRRIFVGRALELKRPGPTLLLSEVVQLLNENSALVGCSSILGQDVQAALLKVYKKEPSEETWVKWKELHVALNVVLPSIWDPQSNLTFIQAKAKTLANASPAVPKRWLIKHSGPLQQANRLHQAQLRIHEEEKGQAAAHLVALEYHQQCHKSTFENIRNLWEKTAAISKTSRSKLRTASMDELVQLGWDKLVCSITDYGFDLDVLFDALNTLHSHPQGPEALCQLETQFNSFVKDQQDNSQASLYNLRTELEQELFGLDKLIACRILNLAHSNSAGTTMREILDILLKEKIHGSSLRYALPSVLPAATLQDKAQLICQLTRTFAGTKDAKAILTILESSLDVGGNPTVEASELVHHMCKIPAQESASKSTAAEPNTVLSKLLFLMTHSDAIMFLQLLIKVSFVSPSVNAAIIRHLEHPAIARKGNQAKVSPDRALAIIMLRLSSEASMHSWFDNYYYSRNFSKSCFNFLAPRSLRAFTKTKESTAEAPINPFWTCYKEVYGEQRMKQANESIEAAAAIDVQRIVRGKLARHLLTAKGHRKRTKNK